MRDHQIEQEIQAKGLTAPRITPADVEANIVSGHYFTAAAGVEGELRFGDPQASDSDTYPDALKLLTFCVLVLKNGFTVTGESACASPENFDAELGRKIAHDNARNKIWQLEGYLLRQRLHETEPRVSGEASSLPAYQQRVIDEQAQLDEKIEKLSAFLDTPTFAQLPQPERHRLESQLVHMQAYSGVLNERIAAFPTN